MLGEELKDFILRKALVNAYKHDGKANADAVIRKLIFYKPETRSQIKSLISSINEIINYVNSLTKEEQYNYLLLNYPEELKKEKVSERKFELQPLPNAKKGIVTRFAPNPDAPLHLGNLRSAILSYEYAKIYEGKFILRFEDTDPKTKRPILHIYPDEEKDYEYILRDLEWFNIYPDEIYIQSDRLNIYYEIAKQIIKKEKAYICFCKKEKIQFNRSKGIECEHRRQGVEENLENFELMINGKTLKNEFPVLRIKTNMKHPDPSIRDWIAMRIIDPKKYVHPRISKIIKYLKKEPYAWPTYNFSVSIDDHLMGITHVFRAKEHINNTIKQRYIFQILGWEEPTIIHYGRIKVKGVVLSKSRIISEIKKGNLEGFDDPDLATIVSYKRRGFLFETLKQAILELGIKPIEAIISQENLNAINRKKIDPIANRYFFICDPVKVKLKLNKKIKIKRQLHPSRKDYFEFDIFPKNNEAIIFISKEDLKDDFEVRLIEFGNFKIKKIEENYEGYLLKDQSLEYAKKNKLKLIQWVYEKNCLNSIVKAPSYFFNKKTINGIAEKEIKKLKVGTVIQFIRFGFVRLDSFKNDTAIFYYLHD